MKPVEKTDFIINVLRRMYPHITWVSKIELNINAAGLLATERCDLLPAPFPPLPLDMPGLSSAPLLAPTLPPAMYSS